MYGQGSYAPHFRQAPPFPQTQPGPPPPPYQQAPPGPSPPPIYQHGLPPPPAPPVQMNMGRPFVHPHPPVHGSAPMATFPPYQQPSYPPPMPSYNAHHVPPPLPSSLGQTLYRTPPPPPPGIQHVRTPPPPPLSSFASFTPSTGSQLPPLPSSPPPLPPSPPPPLPPPPPMPSSLAANLLDVIPEEPSADPVDNVEDMSVSPGTLQDDIGHVEEKDCLAEEDEPDHLPLPPPKPVEEEVVRNIEVLCKYISDVGPEFENFARTKEAGNPQYAFLFGGEPGSTAAVSHTYFQWMKMNYQVIVKSSKDSQQNLPLLGSLNKEGSSYSADLEDQDEGASPAVSDMDTEDDKDLPFTEEVSAARASDDFAACVLEDNVHRSIGASPRDPSLVKGLPTATGGKVEEIPRIFIKDRSPFKLIQGYASDDTDEGDKGDNAEDIKADWVSPKADSDVGAGNELQTRAGLAVTSIVPNETGSPHQKPLSPNVIFSSPADPSDDKKLDDSIGTPEVSKDKDDNDDFGQGDVKKDTAVPDVDEFGRLVRKGSSDSESDGKLHHEKRVKRANSRSPQGSRWRRRNHSPRRRGKLSRSPSRSPMRSGSKSPPSFRRNNEFARRDRDQPPECFNFIRGRCFRGASCRYLHRDFGRDKSRHQEYQEFPQDSIHDKSNFTDKEIVVEECNIPQKEDKPLEMLSHKDMSEASIETIEHRILEERDAADSVVEDAQPAEKKDAQISEEEVSQANDPQIETVVEASSGSPTEGEKLQPLLESSQPPPSPNGKTEPLPSNGTSSQPCQSSSFATSITKQPQNGSQDGHAEDQVSHPLPVQATHLTTSQNQIPDAQSVSSHSLVTPVYPSQSPLTRPYSNYVPINQPSDQPLLPREFLPPPPSLSASGPILQSSQGHPPTLYTSDNTSLPFSSQHPSSFLSQRPPTASDYNPHRVPPNHAWPNLPPPPPSLVNSLPRTDYNPAMWPIPPGDQPRTQVADFRPFHSVESFSHQPPSYNDAFKQLPLPLPLRNQQDRPFVREDRFPYPSMPGSKIISDFQREYHVRHQHFLREDVQTPLPGQGFGRDGAMHLQSLPFTREPLPNKPHFFPEDHLPPRFPPNEQFPNIHGFPHQPPFIDAPPTRYSSSFLENNLPPHLSYTGASTFPISSHYNPYASTFEQAAASVRQENDMDCINRYDSSAKLGHVPVGGPGSRITASPPSLKIPSDKLMVRAAVSPHETPAEVLPNIQKQSEKNSPAGNAYDPLFDSIEPSSTSLKKEDHVKEIDVENNKQKGIMAAEPKFETDEFGEMATDAEVGVVENGSPLPADDKDWSPGVPIDVGNAAAGEIETEQVQTPGKSKKSKDSRTMKLFRIALADFVKEVLKPSWRQGNLSKEAFKTIVKKTVEKVSRSIPSHQIPKTQVKISQYVESSQRKLTKLVMGYIDKYAKA